MLNSSRTQEFALILHQKCTHFLVKRSKLFHLNHNKALGLWLGGQSCRPLSWVLR
mgnify:CR=1 FL=1